MLVGNELEQALAANPAPAAGNEPPGTPGAVVTPPAAPQQDADDLPASVKEYLEKNPDHKPIVELVNKELKGAWTPKLQEAAEARKRIEGIADQDLEAIRTLNHLISTDRSAAAEYLRQIANGISPAQAAANAQAASGDQQARTFYSDMERELWEKQEAISQQLQQIETATFAQHINNEMSRLESDLGLKIPVQERARAGELARKAGIPVTDAWFALNRDAVVKHHVERARVEATAITAEKAGQAAGNPNGVANRGGEGEGAPARTIRDFLARELEAAGET